MEALRQEVPDLKESFEIGREGVGELPNRWPEGNEQAGEFRVTMLRFFEECKMVHVQVMRAIAVGMGLDEGWFDSYTVSDFYLLVIGTLKFVKFSYAIEAIKPSDVPGEVAAD